MVAVILSPLYLLVIFYLLRWNLRWLGSCSDFFKRNWFTIPYCILFLIISCSSIIAFFMRQPHLKWFFKHLSNYWLGTLLYIIFFVVTGDLIRLILHHFTKVDKKKLHSRKTFILGGAAVVSAILLVSIYGIVHARTLKVKEYDITVQKACTDQDLKIALIADLHMGYSIDHTYIEKMVQRINTLEPDLICIAGDIFDNDYDALDDPEAITAALKSLKSKYGTYACWGNHDVSENILVGFSFDKKEKLSDDTRMKDFLENAGITLLNDKTVCINDSFYLVGRRDKSRARKVEDGRLSPEELLSSLDQSKPIFVLEHQPRQIEELAAAGADAHLCGHTHDGQLFPGNLLVAMMYKNAYGLKKFDQMYSVVTSGVGIWGPDMRVGTDSEIVELNVHFEN